MIHDAKVEVTCDREGCWASTEVELSYVYGGAMHAAGKYDDSDKAILESVKKQDWIVDEETSKQYCSEYCASPPEE